MSHEDTLTSLFISLRSSLALTVRGIVPPKEVEDIVQETYVRAFQNTKKDAVQEPRAFLFTIAKNLALDYAKKAETRLSSNIDPAEALENESLRVNPTLDDAVSSEEFSIFCEAVRRLPVQRRRVFVLKRVYGYTQKEIATQMQLSEKTVERHLSLAMQDCMEYIQPAHQMSKNDKRSSLEEAGQ
ncbi:MAG: RNA polymerase sigma factor (sigma-70 family) [Candidatus Pseudothioglobus sp.]|jgi:RNA polymerase sigma factor (sigma-70 family)